MSFDASALGDIGNSGWIIVGLFITLDDQRKRRLELLRRCGQVVPCRTGSGTANVFVDFGRHMRHVRIRSLVAIYGRDCGLPNIYIHFGPSPVT